MCSRYCLTSSPDAVRAAFATHNQEQFPPRYNIAPSQPVLIVRHDHARRRELVLVRWGLIPSWVKDPGRFGMLINARSETADDKASFRGALRHRRCLVPADGFYQWDSRPDRSAARHIKQPYLFRPRHGGPIALAGLWEHWLGADGSEIETMAIMTVEANSIASRVHERMPVVLAPDAYDDWLDVGSGLAAPVSHLLKAAPDDLFEVVEVSTKLNNSRNEGPELQETP